METGFLIIDKPEGITSHDVVDALRRATGVKRVGHAGTLDPFATGLLIIGVGREATRELSHFLKQDKTYLATLRLGAVSDTQDKTGKIQFTMNNEQFTRQKIQATLEQFLGEQEQLPPMYSAKKIGGKKLYELARQGKEIVREKHHIIIHDIKLLEYAWPEATIEVRASSGTYIRALAHDIGQTLGCGAYLETLRRTKIGEMDLKDAVPLDRVTKENWQSLLQTLDILKK